MAAHCVHVEPPCVEFSGVRAGQVYRTTVTATNVGKTSRKITMEKPQSKMYKFRATSSAAVLAPGLSVSGVLEFTPEGEEEVKDCFLVHVDDVETIEIPLLGLPKACSLFMDSVIDFGRVAASNQVIIKQHYITNQGSATGLFNVQYNGDPSVIVYPSSGHVAAGSTRWLTVELRTNKPCLVDEKALVKLQNASAVVLRIRAEVVDQSLEVFDLQGVPLSCLWFGPVYFGTSHMQHVVLRNNSPVACEWVGLLQDNAAGTEMGTDFQKSTSAILLERKERCGPASQDQGSHVVKCVPRQGLLLPYQKATVAVCFSPVYKSTREKSMGDHSASRHDYCLFMAFESVGSRHGFTQHDGNSRAELAVTGSGLPVSLVPGPSENFDFLSCVTGQRVDLLCVLQNLCPQLPVSFRFRKLAHFNPKPSAGTIPAGQNQDVVLSFTARQQGTFRVRQKIDIVGHVQRDGNTADDCRLELGSFHAISLELSAVCGSETTHPGPKLSPGVSPALTNPSGSRHHVQSAELARCRVVARDKTQLHLHRREKSHNSKGREERAFPEDRATSIRPYSAHRQLNRTFTEEEEEQRQLHRQVYTDFIEQLRRTRLRKLKQGQQEHVENSVDIGIVPAQGLVPPKLRICDLEDMTISENTPDYRFISKATRRSCSQRTTPIAGQLNSQVPGVLSSVPCTSLEVADCNKILTAQELCQVDIGPLSVDFGEVCLPSVCVQELRLTNRLPASVWVQLEVDCPELLASSPLSHVLPPHSRNTLPLTFQSTRLGHFYRTVPYSVNQQHPGQILVQAQVVPLALELSTSLLVLQANPALLSQSGYRSLVTLRNKRNHVAEFTWRPVVTDSGILFSIRPAAGAVEPYSELDCEVVWHPSYSSSSEGDFDLCVHEGNTQRLHCVAKVGSSSVQLAEKQVLFGPVPLNKTSIRVIALHNTGLNHAYFQVLDVCPLPGLAVSPAEGVVPRGGHAALNVHFHPDSVFKFDTRVEVALRGMKSIEIRVGGSAEPPNVDISVSLFQFGVVYPGCRREMPFTLTNHSSAAAWLTFHMSEHTDFSLQLPQPSSSTEPGVSVVEIPGKQTVDCSLLFFPTQMASYDFDFPLLVDGLRWREMAGWRNPGRHSSQCTPRIHATVLCPPLELSPSGLHFQIEPSATQPDAYTKVVELKAVGAENVFWRSGVGKHVNWWLDCRATRVPTQDRIGEKLCTVSPSSGSLGPGQSICLVVSISPKATRTVSEKVTKLSVLLRLGDVGVKGPAGDAGPQLYRELPVTVTLQGPRIAVHPPQILLTPVPLECSATATLTLLAIGYPGGTSVRAEVDEVELKNGTKIQPVSVTFPNGNDSRARHQDQTYPEAEEEQECASVSSLVCSVLFRSAARLSLCTTITFIDHLNSRFKVRLCAIADNCQLTVWPYMALHHSEQQIVLKTGTSAVEAVLQRCHSPSPASVPTSSSSSFDRYSSTIKNSTTDSYSDSDSGSGQASRQTDISSNARSPTYLGVPEFPSANSEEGLYYHNVLVAVERWFSLYGWSRAPHPISVPHTFRRVVSKIQTSHSGGRTCRVNQNKDSRSVVDMICHMTGKQVPGIPVCQTFSHEIGQRTNQLLRQHGAMLAFLRLQGASLCHIRPAYLLDRPEFQHWCSLKSKEEDDHGLVYSSVDYESLSKRSWTDVLLQIYKVQVLCRLKTPQDPAGGDSTAPVSSKPLASNVYSCWELQLLSWLNTHYQSTRKAVWGADGVPSLRWIVNFDLDLTDGLVLAAVLAAYCPFLIYSHFRRMYTTTSSLEQILHNNIILCQALTTLCLNMDVQPTDLSDPNPVQMLMLCVHLHEKLPQYLPRRTVTLSGSLYSTFSKQVRLKSPSSKPVKYRASLLGRDAHLFSLPGGSTVTIPPKTSMELTVEFSCSFIQPMEAVLLLISSSSFALCSSTLAFNLKTQVSHIAPVDTVKCVSPCYQLKVIQVPITNPFNTEAQFRVMLVESSYNPLEPEKKKDNLEQASSQANTCDAFKAKTCQLRPNQEFDRAEKMTLDKRCGEEMKGECSNPDGESREFLTAVQSVCLKSGQADTLMIHYLPFSPGIKYCSVLLICPQVGDMVYMVKATAELPLPSPLATRPSSNVSILEPTVCVSALSLRCKVGEVCEEVVRIPLVNMAWEQALAIWGQHGMSVDEHRRRILTQTLHSSTVRAGTAARKFLQQQALPVRGVRHSKGVEYTVDVSLPQNFTLPSTVTLPIKKDTAVPWGNPADCGCVDIPLRFQANSTGQFTCRMVLRSCWDTRVYTLGALVTSEEKSVHLDFSSTAHNPVTQDIPLHNETQQDWKILATVDGEGFSGPEVVYVPAGRSASYPLTFNPAAQCIVTGRLSLQNESDGTELVFSLRGVGEPPLPVDHVLLHCTVGQTTHKQLDVPNYSQKNVTLKVVTDLPVISGPPSLEIKAGNSSPYNLAVSLRKRERLTGCVSFVEMDDTQEEEKQEGDVPGRYKVHFSLEIICEPSAPVKILTVQCAIQSSVAIEMPVTNPRGELLMLDVQLEGEGLSGLNWVCVPPRETLNYRAMFSPGRVAKTGGSVLFQSDLLGEFWYQLELYGLPPPVLTLPLACCQLGKWSRQTIPLVNPTAEAVELTVANSNPRIYTLEMDAGNTLTMEPFSFAQLGVVFRPSIGEESHTGKITLSCPQLQDWSVLLRGCVVNTEPEEPLSIPCLLGSEASFTVPFTNPTELPVELAITLTDEDPSGAPSCYQVSKDKGVFSIPLSYTEGIQVSEGASFDVPVLFAPNSMELQQAWLFITMKPLLNNNNNNCMDNVTSEQGLVTTCWCYPLRGIPMGVPVENSPLGPLQCEAGCRLQRRVDLPLTGCEPGDPDGSQVMSEDFSCQVRSAGRTEPSDVLDCLCASVETAKRDPQTGAVTLTLSLVYTPLRPCKCSAALSVQYLSCNSWKFPISLTATEPQVDDVILIEATPLAKTSAVGFRLTSTTGSPEPFSAALEPGSSSSSEFTVSPASGVLPPDGSAGALITVSFTPSSQRPHRATLTIKAAEMQWTYEVIGRSPDESPPLSATSTND